MQRGNNGEAILESVFDSQFAGLALGMPFDADFDIVHRVYTLEEGELPYALSDNETKILIKGLQRTIEEHRELDEFRTEAPGTSRIMTMVWLDKLGVELPEYKES